ncbi:penicillin-binding protein 2 [Geothermobacter hydrogeniphilus]|uniref:Beta-lactamase n=1 Tax=Geothermobacter hydrogeniphilus TaxID=1969733 RepID=A0A1X0YCZ4_9BACT|nr:penicillin-binding protein 2 [Geothermobacter hydrogeniphilus]ORJ62986.1 penicillin-binding protein 2 [Geothermobacter hydrogeniphilus]
MGLNGGWDKGPQQSRRLLVVSLVALLVFLLLIMRLWYLQVISGQRYSELSEKNRIRYVPLTAPRGPIYDRNGELLIDNRPSFNISVMRQDVDDPEKLLGRLAELLQVPAAELLKRWQAGRRLPPYRPVRLADDVGREKMEIVQEHAPELPGVLVEVHPLRAYPNGELAAHLFGYIGEITEDKLQDLADDGYRSGDFIGKSGLEKELEPYLRGKDGERLLEVDVRGKEMRSLRTREPVPGDKVYLTIDRELQRATEKAFGDQAGAAVALDVASGEILAMASRPSFDPEQFARGISPEEWKALLNNPRHPLQNKALRGQYPPGSTFKIVTALAALEAGVATPRTTVDDEGAIELGRRVFRCWKKGGHGRTNLKKALRESCDVWFYRVALDLGIDKLSEMAFALGLGRPTGVLLEGEKSGLIPTRDWKHRRFNERWYDGETVIAAIGQGYDLATPLQLAVMTAAVANGGKVMRPQILKRIEDMSGQDVLVQEPEQIRAVALSPKNLAAVRKGLEAVVNEPHGTGWRSKLTRVRVAGKTGTAQVVRRKSTEEEEQQTGKDKTPYRFRDHALFVAYAPADNPQIAVAVVVEHGRHGSTSAAPIAREMFRSYFHIEDLPQVDGPGYLGD